METRMVIVLFPLNLVRHYWVPKYVLASLLISVIKSLQWRFSVKHGFHFKNSLPERVYST